MALEQFSIFAAQMAIVWVDVGDLSGCNLVDSGPTDVNLCGSWLGLMTQSLADGSPENARHPGDRLTAERFGHRIARTTACWAMGAEAFPPQPISNSEASRRNRAGPDERRKFDD